MKRSNKVNFVVSDKEMRIIRERAKDNGMSMATYIRYIVVYKEEANKESNNG